MTKHVEPLGISFVEFAGNRPDSLCAIFQQLRIPEIGSNEHRSISVHAQGKILLIANRSDGGHARRFHDGHGPGICAIGVRVHDAQQSWEMAVGLGAEPVVHTDHEIPAIHGIGDSVIYLCDAESEARLFRGLNCRWPRLDPNEAGWIGIDHLTFNLRAGGIDRWRSFFETVFGFSRAQTFDIKGKHTGLHSEVVIDTTGELKFALNESEDPRSQINEFIDALNGEGIQHVALECCDIYAAVRLLEARGVCFQQTGDAYYQMIDERVPGHHEPLADLKDLNILIDGNPDKGRGTLLQIFTKESIGPLFFEVIQRKGNSGFGNGNFQALFESIELDQKKRGVL